MKTIDGYKYEKVEEGLDYELWQRIDDREKFIWINK